MTRYLVARANALMLVVLIALLLLVGGVTWQLSTAARTAQAWSQHTNDVLVTIKDLDLAIRSAETGQRGFLLTGEESYLAPYQGAIGRVSLLQGELQRLSQDNATQQERLRALAPVVQHKLEELAQTIQLRRSDGLPAALGLVRTDLGRALMQQIETALAAMTAEEQRLLATRLTEAERRSVWLRVVAVGGTLIAVLSLAWATRMLNQAHERSGEAMAEQRALAQQLRASLDSLSQGVAVFDSDHRLINWNHCFQVLLDVPRALVRAGTPYAALVEHCAEDGAPFLETDDEVRHGPNAAGEPIAYERQRREGQFLEVRRTPTADGGFVLTLTDLTKRAQAEAVLRESQKMQALGHLTGGLAHDFNNLLTVMLGNLEFIRAKLDTANPLHARVDRAAWAAQRGATLTAQLLAFARRQPLAPAPIDLAATLPDLIPLLRRTLGEHIEVRYVETAGLWPAMADAAQLESALLNLALNARDAMPGGGRLTIELGNRVLDRDYARRHAEVTPGDYTMLAVSDTGHGMAPDVLARVFEPFFTTKPDGKGTGLGLPMVFGFVKQSGGHVNIYSEPGEGTTIRLYLPRAINAAAVVQRSVAPIALPRGSATVLVVEDEAAVREIACAILGDLGYHVLEAADGEEALQVFAANGTRIDLLLSDVVLPGKVRGRELAERIVAIRPEMRVLFMSGYTENSIVHHGRLDDGVQLLGKPFKREQLAAKVAEVLARPLPPQPLPPQALPPQALPPQAEDTAGSATLIDLARRRAT